MHNTRMLMIPNWDCYVLEYWIHCKSSPNNYSNTVFNMHIPKNGESTGPPSALDWDFRKRHSWCASLYGGGRAKGGGEGGGGRTTGLMTRSKQKDTITLQSVPNPWNSSRTHCIHAPYVKEWIRMHMHRLILNYSFDLLCFIETSIRIVRNHNNPKKFGGFLMTSIELLQYA